MIAAYCSNLQLFHWLFWPFGQAYQPRLECLKTCPEGEGNAQSWQSIELWQLRHGMGCESAVLCALGLRFELSHVESCWVCCILLSLLSLQLPGQCSLSAGWDCASLNFGPQVELFRCPRPWRELSRRVKVRSLAGGCRGYIGWEWLG